MTVCAGVADGVSCLCLSLGLDLGGDGANATAVLPQVKTPVTNRTKEGCKAWFTNTGSLSVGWR